MVLIITDTPSERQLAVSKLVQTLTAYQRMVILSPVCLEGNSIPVTLRSCNDHGTMPRGFG